MSKCPRCNTLAEIAPGIGPYCPNLACNAADDLRPNWQSQHSDMLSQPRSRPAMTDTTRMRIFALGLALGIACGFVVAAVAAMGMVGR